MIFFFSVIGIFANISKKDHKKKPLVTKITRIKATLDKIISIFVSEKRTI